MKRIIFVLFFIVLATLLLNPRAMGQENLVNIYFFWSKTCSHCAKMKPFVESYVREHSDVRLYSFEISTNFRNSQLLQQAGRTLGADVSGVPFTVIGKTSFAGWSDQAEAKEQFAAAVEKCLEVVCEDPLLLILPTDAQPVGFPTPTPTIEVLLIQEIDPSDIATSEALQEETVSLVSLPSEVTIPVLGKVKTRDLSLPVLTFVIALLDGFNPCAMWVLLFLISLLLGIESRSRRWILGFSFLFASGLVYFLFLAAWLNLFLFLGWVFWLRILVGMFAIGIGIAHLRDWYLKQTGCVVGSSEKRQKIFGQIREVILRRQLLWAVVGIVLLAFAVNLVELVCSFALPAAYTQALTLNNLPTFQYYAYLLFYIFIFMLDDLIVFVVAMVTLEAVGIESKYSRFVALVGGFLMLLIGLALVFKPELLRFGM